MQKIFSFFLILTLMGCASIDQIQGKMNLLDSNWRIENEKLIQALGTKYYKLPKEQAHSAMLLAFTNLEMSIENQDLKTGYINAVGRMPRPLTHVEFNKAWEIDKPKAYEITGLNIQMSGNSNVILTALIIERADDVQINLRFRTKYIGNTYGLIISDQAPPAAVKVGYPKIWDEFEKVAFIQGRVIYGNK
jgi:hypothetical protein